MDPMDQGAQRTSNGMGAGNGTSDLGDGGHGDGTALQVMDGMAGPESRGQAAPKGLRIERYFTEPGAHPYDLLQWEKRSASITGEKGEVIFEQKDVEFPTGWSMLATNVVVSKYFRGALGTPERETSLRQLIDRVAKTIAGWGRKQGYFQADRDAETFEAELTYLLVNQLAAFNSPVWFNVGIQERPQCSACFINSVKDDMASILELAKTEGMLFKWGSGTGTNLSPIRSSRERLSAGGKPSGPVSFMRGYDAFAGVIKSGGKTRRAAKMVILDVDHPDIEEFVECKASEERKAWALIDAGYDGSFGGEAYDSIFFQNSNNSVRVTDDFMRAVIDDKEWQTHAVTSGEPVDTYRARDLMAKIAEAAWACGDPGMQYDTTINDWHTCAGTDRIYASNPCSEYMFLDDTACNLASLNLMKFRRPATSLPTDHRSGPRGADHRSGPQGPGTPPGAAGSTWEFDTKAFRHAVRVLLVAQDIIVDNASYPTPKIGENSPKYRPLGLGYANLGALLMAKGLPYDSDEGRAYAGAVTALMHGEAYRTSAEMARSMGTFAGFEPNHDPMLRVLHKHKRAVRDIRGSMVPDDLMDAVEDVWEAAVAQGESYGYRNSQVTVLAPTGTIGFMMDCDTTGVEPDIALVKYKKLSGGGLLKIVNQTVPEALAALGYTPEQAKEIVKHIEAKDTIEGAPHLKEEHLPVFDCAFKPLNGKRSIHYMGHVRMMGATQPFLSGAISKTVNMPEDATPEEIAQVYVDAWKLGVKAIAIYRDGCKKAQPLNTSATDTSTSHPSDTTGDLARKDAAGAAAADQGEVKPVRRRLPDERRSITHKFSVGGHEGYVTVGMYEDGAPGELFITMAKEGSVISGLMDSVATAVSIALQYGVPLEVLVNKFAHTRFEPSGFTSNPKIRIAKSLMDYIFRWLAMKFLEGTGSAESAGAGAEDAADGGTALPAEAVSLEEQASIAGGSSLSAADAGKVPARAAAPENVPQDALAAAEKSTFEQQADAPPCHNCGSIMIRSGACYKCMNCGETSGCS